MRERHSGPPSSAQLQREGGAVDRTGPAAEMSVGLERMIFFSDAVFAIVITLLVLPLTAEIVLPEGGQDLAAQVWAQWPRVLSFVVSFLVIGQFWIAHHHMFEYIRGYDQGLLWLNLISLLTVSFMPFPTALIGARLETDAVFPVVFYAASMTVSSLALTTSWIYAVRRRLLNPAVPAAAVRAFTGRALATSAVFLLSVGAAFFGLPVAMLFWLVLLPLARLLLVRVPGRRHPQALQTLPSQRPTPRAQPSPRPVVPEPRRRSSHDSSPQLRITVAGPDGASGAH